MPVTFWECPWQITECGKMAVKSARDIFARDISKTPVTIFKKMPVTSKKWPWQISKIECHAHKKMSRGKKKHWFGCNLSLNVFWISLIVLSINSLTIQYFSSWRKIISNLHGKLSTHTKYFFLLHIWSTIRQDLLTKFSRTSQTNSHSRIIMYFGPSHSDFYLMFCFEPNAPFHAWCPSS